MTLGAVLLLLWLPAAVSAQSKLVAQPAPAPAPQPAPVPAPVPGPQPVKDGSGKTVGNIDKTKTNCIGYACNTGGSLDPVLSPAGSRTSLKELFTALGYTCNSGVSAKDCKDKCKPNEYMMLYVYIMKEYDFDKVKKKFEGKDPFNDPIITPDNELDYHGLRGGDSGYTYQSHRDDKANENIKTFTPTDGKPDYFSDPKQLLGKYCCCRAPKMFEGVDDEQPFFEDEQPPDATGEEGGSDVPPPGGA